jgi:hypothetical protein
MVTEHWFPEMVVHDPLQLVKAELASGVAERVTTVPLAYVELQPVVLPVVQLMFVPVTVPLPVPASVTVNG